MLRLLHLTDLFYLKSIKPRKPYILWSTRGREELKASYERSFVTSTLHLSPQCTSWWYIHRSTPALAAERPEWNMQPLRSADPSIRSASFAQEIAALRPCSFSWLYLLLTGTTSWSRKSSSVPINFCSHRVFDFSFSDCWTTVNQQELWRGEGEGVTIQNTVLF